MLRQNHRFTKLNRCTRHWQGYRLHMCGLCHALGDDYGQLSRLLTSRELILLNMLVSAQLPEIETVERRCPLNPMMHVQTNASAASEFSAAMAVKLSEASVADDRQDEGGFIPYLAQLALQKPVRQANHILVKLNFIPTNLEQLTHQQSLAETHLNTQPEAPSAQLSADIFAMTASLADLPNNTATLNKIGQAYGATIYWLDAYVDFAQDMQTGAFNLLRAYAETPTTLSLVGLQFLHEKFKDYERIIQQNLTNLDVYRYRSDLETLLLEPLDRVCAELKRLIQQEKDLRFQVRPRRWGLISFVALILTLFGLSFTQYDPELPDYEDRHKKRRESCANDGYCEACCYCCVGDGHSGSSCCDASTYACCDCCADEVCSEICDGDSCDCGGGCCDSCGDCDCDCDCS